ncbi:MAG TPA: hypothetical protein VF883_16355 [Thermoanaerobaculia bacterium]|jgi:hypothetical protein
MRTWPEFVRGEEYSVELERDDEQVSVFMVERSVDDHAYVVVRGEFGGRLFLLVVGAVTYALAAHSDDVTVMRWESADAVARGGA